MSKKRLAAGTALVLLLASVAAVASVTATAKPTKTSASVKVGFITKFPVDFYDTMVTAVKDWNKSHADVQVVFAQGKSGTDDEGEIVLEFPFSEALLDLPDSRDYFESMLVEAGVKPRIQYRSTAAEGLRLNSVSSCSCAPAARNSGSSR